MKKYLLILIPLIILGCPSPYKSAVFRHIQASSDLNQVANELGSAMSQEVVLGPVASGEIRDALDAQVLKHGIAIYALEVYQMGYGVSGYAPLESAAKDLHNANKRIVDIVHKHVGGR